MFSLIAVKGNTRMVEFNLNLVDAENLEKDLSNNGYYVSILKED